MLGLFQITIACFRTLKPIVCAGGGRWDGGLYLGGVMYRVTSGAKLALLIKTPVSYSGESDYPGIVSISNSDPDTPLKGTPNSCLGQYSVMEGESSHGAPVYKHNDNEKRFFFRGKNKFWYCSYTHGPTAGGFLWASWTNGAWTDGAWTKGVWTMKSSPKSFVIEG